ncbi:MAG: OmpA family protein [Myxococcota bacterium]
MIRPARTRAPVRRAILLIAWLGLLVSGSPERAVAQAVPGTCPASLGTADLIDHDLSVSFCELCSTGTVRIEIVNPFDAGDDVDFAELVVAEDLQASGLTYVPNSTTFTTANVATPAVVQPTISGANGQILTWDLSSGGFSLPGRNGGGGNKARLFVEFEVERAAALGDEGLVAANRSIDADVTFEPSCAPGETFTDSTGSDTLPLREPEPVVIKQGRNVDAGQGAGSYSDPVYGHEGDDVIWRIRVRNDGDAPLQDFVFTDTMAPGNMTISHVCDTEAGATAIATGGASADCVALGSVTTISNLDVRATFGGAANPYIVAPAGGSGFYYFVGKIDDSCVNRTNTVSDVEWGCQSQPPAGGIAATSGGATAGDTALLSTASVAANVQIDVALTGVVTSQPMGATGIVAITIRNQSGGTIHGEATGLRLRSVLPAEYVIDPTFTPTVTTTPAYGANYLGMIDTVAWTNPVAGTFPLTTTDPALPLANTDLDFVLTSSTTQTNPSLPDQEHMIRHGDVVTVRFRTVLIDPTYYDFVADLDVRQESPASTPPNTDPTASFPITSQAEAWWEEFCTATLHNRLVTENDTARPEDLDVDVFGSELVFILTNTGDPLPLRVDLTNRGGHRATDYSAYVTFGEAMTVSTVPAGCSPTTNPPARPAWTNPVTLPATAAVYVCNRGTINPGATTSFDFEVVKNTAASFDDDLTFRADVIGEITLSDATPLWFPTPTARADGITDRANDYTVDAIWARVVGYNLFKTQLGLCSENNVPPQSPDDEVQIGEECDFHIESGGWFGFDTPGFTYIAVQNARVIDNIPDGQAYISSTDPVLQSTPAIQGIALNPPPAPLDEGPFDWTSNTVVPAERITEKDHWFRVDVKTRLENDPIDTRAAPNVHADQSSNVMTSTFDAVFFNSKTGLEELYSLGPNTVGYPREVHRRVDLTVTEPNLIVTKEVCNETRYGSGPACSNFQTLVDDGDAFDTYVYRITVTNEATSGGVTRAPAYDVTVTSTADPSDLLFVDPLSGDGLENDGDGLLDAGDAGGEGTITDNVVQNAVPAQIIASYTHSDALLELDAGESVVFYYRVDPDDDAAPLQALVGSAIATYDSLEGASGAQTAPQGSNGQIGGARQYTSAPAEATIQIIPVEVRPKQILATSNTPLVLAGSPQPVSIGEEVRYQLEALIPVAQLRSFQIVDELPAGIRCVDAPVVDLDAPPYDAAGFVPGGAFTPTCTDTQVIWNFGNQTVTSSNRVDRRFEFEVQFVARVDNVAGNQDGTSIVNGGAATVTEVRYVNEASQPIVLPIDEAELVVREPSLSVTKTFSVTDVDAGDRPRVTVTLTNDGTATAYNPRVLDDLLAPLFAYVGDVQGTNPPTADVLTLGADRPIFAWPAGFAIAPSEVVTFSFAVEVEGTAQPEQILSNTVQADWTSLPLQTTALNSGGTIGANGAVDGMRNGALPNAGDAVNDYEAEATDDVTVRAVAVDKSDLSPAVAPEIGAHKQFQIEIQLPEGTTQNVAVDDALDSGSVGWVLEHDATYDVSYEFVGITTINGLPPDETAFTAPPPIDETTGVAIWTIGTVVTASEDDLAATALSPVIRIRYSARIENDLATNVGETLQNAATVSSTHGQTGLPTTVADAVGPFTVIESALTATKTLSNVTSGKLPTDPPAYQDVLQYVVTIVNGGNATAWDVNVVDTLPSEVRLYAGFTPTAVVNAAPVAGFVPAPSGGPAGPLVWGRANGDTTLDIPAGGFLELTYQVEVSTPPADGATLSNSVWIDWTSLDVDPGSLFERTGAGCPTVTPPNDYCYGPAVATGTVDPAPVASPVLKETTQATAAIGEIFRYRITVPQTPYAFPAYDVRIYDDLTTSAANLRFVSVSKVSGSGAWTPSNTGTPTNLVIEDPANGIDIPAGEQVVVEIAVVLEDTPTNVHGLSFTNTANYLYNWLDGNLTTQRNGTAGTSAAMTIVGPETVTLTKTGPATMTLGAPATFTLDVQNTGDGAAWNLSLQDRLPNGPNAGTCDAPASAFTAQVFAADGTTPISGPLAAGTDFVVTSRGEPDCDFSLSLLTPATTIGPGERLIVTYEALLDADSQDGEALTNVAGAVDWYSADGSVPATAGDRRQYTRTLTDGTVGTLDHEDAYTTTVALPLYYFEKTVMNVTTGQSPATTANPGDVLRYHLRVENLRSAPLDDLAIVDTLDALNTPPAFVAGTLAWTSVPPGADTSATDPNGGAAGTGLLDVRGFDLAANASVDFEFEIQLRSVLANGSSVSNQADLSTGGVPFAQSDDPNVNGQADAAVDGDEDPTRVQIQSAPVFVVQKVSDDVTLDPLVLLAGETLRYTITVQNVGSDDASDAMLRDAVPANTSYVAGSTTLNGLAVTDGPGGTSPLANGIPIYAPENMTPGALRADAAPGATNVATIRFDVVVDPAAPDGTVIANQGFVSAVLGGVVDTPSDDPDTAVPNDPTLDVVGAEPLLFAPKAAALLIDTNGAVGVVDPGDTLRYTITVYNNGAAPATQAVLQDVVPANTTYVPDSTTLNGIALGADGGVFPLAAGLPISTADRTPPLPNAGEGQLSRGAAATVTFDLVVAPGTPAGTLITNQARVTTAELPNVLTDGDGNPATGPEPTVVLVGGGQQLSISKLVTVVGGGPALPGSQLEYTVLVRNIATTPATNVVLTDDLDAPLPGQKSYVAASATLNGLPAGVTVAGSLITADYGATYGDLAPGATVTLRFRVLLDGGLAMGTLVTNTGVVTWNAPPQQAQASVSIAIGGTPGVGTLSGSIWHDADFDRSQGGSERALAGWLVDLYRNGTPVQTATADSNGAWRMSGVAPNDVNGDAYRLAFRAPDAGANTASLGVTESPFTNGQQEITNVVVPAGSNLLGLSLPIDPDGVVYEAILRTPVAGTTLSLLNGATPVAASCFDDPQQQGQRTGSDGYYKFDLNFSDASCPAGADYSLAVVPPGTGFTTGISAIIPPQAGPIDVPSCPGGANDAIPATGTRCEVQDSAAAPPAGFAPRSPQTDYYLTLTLDDSAVPGSSQLFNNHIPVDPITDGLLAISKTTPKISVSKGDLVPYEITFTNGLPVPVDDLTLVDTYPAGFRYIEGSARVDGIPTEPTRAGRTLTWTNLGIAAGSTRTVVLLLAVGAGVNEGEFVNRAQGFSSLTTLALSGVATATVRVVPDPTFDCTDVIGKVFDDANHNGYQDQGEHGLPDVRVMTVNGLAIHTDPHGRFHITCAVVPHPARGSNFMLKLDDRTLPSGYRMTTRQAQVLRATRGKALRFSFGASIHRVVGLDLADAVFEPGTTELRTQWKPSLAKLLDELDKGDSILRLTYIADVESKKLVERRLRAIERSVREAWAARGGEALEVETEIYWRRGGPVNAPDDAGDERDAARPRGRADGEPIGGLESTLPHVGAGPPDLERSPAASGERLLPADAPLTPWTVDPAVLDAQKADRLEVQDVVVPDVEIVKLRGVVPPIHFESGHAEIPPDSVTMLRRKLDEMQHLDNVRLHLVGHADDRPLKPGLIAIYGDNEGLSRERAGEVAEHLQRALELPPESIAYEWAGDTQPIASNATAEGRARNRRVEVEVWYDAPGQKTVRQEVVVPDEIRRFKVCRTERVCKLRYKEGQQRRARIRNLIPPLEYRTESIEIPDDFVRQIAQALQNLSDKQHVTVKFIAHTDDTPLAGRAERIYGTPLALSKARAHRVALAIKERLDLPTSAIASDGFGDARPVASNATPEGRAKNRRIEVELWHDDPLLDLPDEMQVCPDEAGAETVTRVYDPPWGRLEPLAVVEGQPVLPADYTDKLRRAMDDIADKRHVRLRFTGYTRNERLSRRQADVYGDDIGLSASRARRAMEHVREAMGLTAEQAEHEGHGFVHADDVVNGGFIADQTDSVRVQVVYDEDAIVDDYDGVEVTPIVRELVPRDPLALNLMRITVDGEPIDDPGRSSADIQRCTDVALDRTRIAFRFDELESARRLSVTAEPRTVALDAATPFEFRTYSNYAHAIARSEIRIFPADDSPRGEPLAIVDVDAQGRAAWLPALDRTPPAPAAPLQFVLRAYSQEGRFDETAPQSLWVAPAGSVAPLAEPDPADPKLLAGYGESEPAQRNIELGSTGSVRVSGEGVPENHSVYVAGQPVPVNDQGEFVGEVILPSGLHTVEVAVLDEEGNGELFLRDLDLERDDWFLMAIADVTLAMDLTDGPDTSLGGNNSDDLDAFANGRFAFFGNGKWGKDWRLTASADTREGPIQSLFSNFLDKSPDALFRRLDPDYYYPTFGDESSIDQLAPTNGKFFVKLEKGDDHLMWGNFLVRYAENELTLVERGLYGANAHFQSSATTSVGERRFVLDGFAADPGTITSREDFRGTGGSLFFMKHRDLLIGSERLRVEIRDKASGIVQEVVNLQPELDYDLDYIQGRILLSEPLSTIANDRLLVRNDGLSGNEVWLVVQYEYTPGFNEIDALNSGGTAQAWVTDWLRLGATANHNAQDGNDSSLYGVDAILRKTPRSYLKLQAGRSEGLVSHALRSDDGGFSFGDPYADAPNGEIAWGYRADAVVELADWLEGFRGQVALYGQRLEAGYSAPGLNRLTDTDQYGGTARLPLGRRFDVTAKADRIVEKQGLTSTVGELNVGYQISDDWRLQTGARHDARDDDAPVVATTQQQGDRTDVVAQIEFDTHSRFKLYAFGQGTVHSTEDRKENHRGGIGGAVRVSDRISLSGEASHGTLGPAAQIGTSWQRSEQSKLYMNYALDSERGYDGLAARRGGLTIGARSRITDHASVFAETQYQHVTVQGLTRSMGVDYAPSERWTIGTNWEDGLLTDRRTGAETERRGAGLRVGYRHEGLSLSSGVEYVFNDIEAADGTKSERSTWLFRNNAQWQMNDDGRLLAKLNKAISNSSQGDFFDGGFTEAVLGYAYRPVLHDRFNALVKYTYFYNVPTTDQVGQNGSSAQYIQKSHIASVDLTYDVTRDFTLGAKYAYRLSQVSLDRDDPHFFDNDAHLAILRADYRFVKNWETSIEGRLLELPDLNERRAGALATLYRYFGDHLKAGIGYNFTDFSEDLTDLSYDNQGIFFNVIGTF